MNYISFQHFHFFSFQFFLSNQLTQTNTSTLLLNNRHYQQMSYFFGRDLWDEIDRINSQMAQLSQNKDKKSGDDDSDCKVETYSYFFPPSDVVEKDDSYLIAIDLPGVKKEDITMDLHQNKLSVSGTRKPKYLPDETPKDEKKEEKMEDDEIVVDKKPEEKKEEKTEEPPKKKEEQEKITFLSCKCGYGDFKRVFTVPSGCQPDDISAKMEDGVLYITIKKAKVPEPRRITVM